MKAGHRFLSAILIASFFLAVAGCDRDIILVPVRACVVRGSTFELKERVSDPTKRESAAAQVSEAFSDVIPIWRDGAKIGLPLYPDVKVIDDPDIATGVQGEIEQDLGLGGESSESAAVAALCDSAWRDTDGIVPPGIAVIFVRSFISSSGRKQTNLEGFSPPLRGVYSSSEARLCATPFLVAPEDLAGRHALIRTFDSGTNFAVPLDRLARTTAHEIGHVLLVAHGNGLDDDGNGKSDEQCDYREYESIDKTLPGYAAMLMAESSAWGTAIGPRQKELARAAAKALAP